MPKNNDKENLESLIIKWINNAGSNVINDSVLWINDVIPSNYLYGISKNIVILAREKPKLNLISILKQDNCIVAPYNSNIEISKARLTEFLKIILLHKKILVVPYELQNLLLQKESNTDILTNNANVNQNTKSDEFYIENIDVEHIIRYSLSELKLFLVRREKQISYLSRDSEVNNMYVSIENEELIPDLIMLDQHKILTSRLAIYIYRCANFDFSSSTTAIGIYFRKTLGTKSKVFNKKRNSILVSTRDNFKAYDLKNSPIEEIARKLLELKREALTDELIANITGLTIKKIRDLRPLI